MSATLRIIGIYFLYLYLNLPTASARRLTVPLDDDPVTQRAKIHLESGVAHFNEGQFADAEREMLRAYELRPVPELQYNLAQCQERLGALDRALASYRAYLRGRPEAPDAGEVEMHIVDLEKRINDAKAQAESNLPKVVPEPAPTIQNPLPTTAVHPANAPEKVVFKEIIVFKETPPKPGRGARYVGWGLVGLAAVGLIAGVALNITANLNSQTIDVQSQVFQQQFGLPIASCRDSQLVEQAIMSTASKDANVIAGSNVSLQQQVSNQLLTRYRPIAMNICDLHRSAADNGQLSITGAAIGYTVAGLATIGAVSLFLYGRQLDRKQGSDVQKEHRVPNLALLPYGGPGGGGLALVGQF